MPTYFGPEDRSGAAPLRYAPVVVSNPAEVILAPHVPCWIHEATRDVVGLWNLCQTARHDWGAENPTEVKALVLGFVRELLANGVQAINVGDLQAWPDQRPDSVIERISREWDALGHEPNVPDIVWFKKKN